MEGDVTTNRAAAKKGITLTPRETTQTIPNLFAQTLDASPYRGKTVRFRVEVQCDERFENQSGAFILASQQEKIVPLVGPERVPKPQNSPYVAHRTLVAVSSAADGRSEFSVATQAKRQEASVEPSTSFVWKQVSVQFDVPNNADHISFGCYTKVAKLDVRDARFQVAEGLAVSEADRSQMKIATADIPCNVLVVPGYDVRKEPSNLDFPKTSVATSDSSVREAARPSKDDSR